MALNIPSTQIYAGRYHHKKMEMPNLLDEKQQSYTTQTKYVRDELSIDTVTFSDEGLAGCIKCLYEGNTLEKEKELLKEKGL